MKVVKPGHTYELSHLDGNKTQTLQFVQRKPHHEPKEGTNSQEVLRALIDRVIVLDKEKPWPGNEKILHHLRSAILLHEIRALQRKLEKGELKPELVLIGDDGHFKLYERDE